VPIECLKWFKNVSKMFQQKMQKLKNEIEKLIICPVLKISSAINKSIIVCSALWKVFGLELEKAHLGIVAKRAWS